MAGAWPEWNSGVRVRGNGSDGRDPGTRVGRVPRAFGRSSLERCDGIWLGSLLELPAERGPLEWGDLRLDNASPESRDAEDRPKTEPLPAGLEVFSCIIAIRC